MSEWRPIGTAPKDGTAVLLAWAIDADGDPIQWNTKPSTAGSFVQVARWSQGEDWWWVYINTPADTPLHFNPTHWMPLPEPPQ
jgi:hypothetical protein